MGEPPAGATAADITAPAPPEVTGPPLPQPAGHHRWRARRSGAAALLPGLLTPADVPDDAAGRVLFVAPTLPPDDELPPAVEGGAAPPEPARSEVAVAEDRSSWVAVAALGIAIVVLFILGMSLFH